VKILLARFTVLISLSHKQVSEVNMTSPLFDNVKRSINFDLHYGDGLQWICTGLFGLLIIPALAVSFVFAFAYFLMLPLYTYLKKKYVAPRRGIAKVRIDPMPKSIFLGTGLAILYALIILGGGYWAYKNNYEGIPMLTFSVTLLLLVAGTWTYYTLNEWDGKHPYPIMERILFLLVILCLPLSNYSMLHLAISWGIYSLFNIVMGCWQFRRFIINNPVIDHEE